MPRCQRWLSGVLARLNWTTLGRRRSWRGRPTAWEASSHLQTIANCHSSEGKFIDTISRWHSTARVVHQFLPSFGNQRPQKQRNENKIANKTEHCDHFFPLFICYLFLVILWLFHLTRRLVLFMSALWSINGFKQRSGGNHLACTTYRAVTRRKDTQIVRWKSCCVIKLRIQLWGHAEECKAIEYVCNMKSCVSVCACVCVCFESSEPYTWFVWMRFL